MKLIGKFKELLTSSEDVILSFTVPKNFYTQAAKIPEDKLLTLDIDIRSGQRSLRQNRALWALLTEITAAENGGLSPTSKVNHLYKELIVEANIKVFYMKVDVEALPILQKSWRVVDILHESKIGNITYIGCNLYKGSSNFDTKEMADFIDIVLDRGKQHNVDILYYEYELGTKTKGVDVNDL